MKASTIHDIIKKFKTKYWRYKKNKSWSKTVKLLFIFNQISLFSRCSDFRWGGLFRSSCHRFGVQYCILLLHTGCLSVIFTKLCIDFFPSKSPCEGNELTIIQTSEWLRFLGTQTPCSSIIRSIHHLYLWVF